MDDQWPEYEQLMELALSELQLAQRFAAIGTDEAIEISLVHVSKADSYIKQLHAQLPLDNEQEQPDLPTA